MTWRASWRSGLRMPEARERPARSPQQHPSAVPAVRQHESVIEAQRIAENRNGLGGYPDPATTELTDVRERWNAGHPSREVSRGTDWRAH